MCSVYAKCVICVSVVFLCLFTIAHPVRGGPTYTTTLSFYQGFDIDHSMSQYDPRVFLVVFGRPNEIEFVEEPEHLGVDFSPGTDVLFRFDVNAANPLLLALGDGMHYAVLDDTPLGGIDPGLLGDLDMMTGIPDLRLDPNDTVVLLTDDGGWFLLGDILYDPETWSVSFSYTAVDPTVAIPEPGTLTLVGLGCVYLLITRRRHHTHNKNSG